MNIVIIFAIIIVVVFVVEVIVEVVVVVVIIVVVVIVVVIVVADIDVGTHIIRWQKILPHILEYIISSTTDSAL
jgi:hypothetical protein